MHFLPGSVHHPILISLAIEMTIPTVSSHSNVFLCAGDNLSSQWRMEKQLTFDSIRFTLQSKLCFAFHYLLSNNSSPHSTVVPTPLSFKFELSPLIVNSCILPGLSCLVCLSNGKFETNLQNCAGNWQVLGR